MKTKHIFILSVAACLMWQCTDVEDFSDPKDDVAPGPVTGVRVENRHGGARIEYQLPGDKDLLGVKAVYRFNESGEDLEMFSSAFVDSILLKGYPDTKKHRVELYAIDKSMNLSVPVQIEIEPMTPPVQLIRESMEFIPTFGGIRGAWENPYHEDIALMLYVEDERGEMVLNDTYYSNAGAGTYSFRGFTSEDTKFRVELRDRWSNYAEPMEFVEKPLHEIEIPGKDNNHNFWIWYGFQDRTCLDRGDISSQTGRVFERLFDGVYYPTGETGWWNSGMNYLSNFIPWTEESSWGKNDYAFPMHLTLDMTKPASYSRFKFWIRGRPAGPWVVPCPIEFELWGTNELKPLETGEDSRIKNLQYWTEWEEIGGTGAWKNDWTKLGTYSVSLPSGARLSSDPITQEDRDFLANGFDFDIDEDVNGLPFRYLRLVEYQQNDGSAQFQLGELKFFGAYSDEE